MLPSTPSDLPNDQPNNEILCLLMWTKLTENEEEEEEKEEAADDDVNELYFHVFVFAILPTK